MCLGVPGRVTELYTQDDLPMGKVEFGGVFKEVCLAYTPEVAIGDYVLVHVGFALSRIDQTEAREVLSCLEGMVRATASEEGAQTESGKEVP